MCVAERHVFAHCNVLRHRPQKLVRVGAGVGPRLYPLTRLGVGQDCVLDPFEAGEPSLPSGLSPGVLGEEGFDFLRGSTALEEFSQAGSVPISHELMVDNEP